MYQQVLTSLILRYFRQYIENIEADIQLGLWGGDVILNDLDLKLDVINKTLGIGAPFSISKGSIKKLKLKIAWSSIRNTPVEIILSSVDIHLSNNPNTTTSSLMTNANYLSQHHKNTRHSDGAKSVDHMSEPMTMKNDNIDDINDEKLNDDETDETPIQQNDSSSGPSFVSNLMMNIIGNASITINDLTIKYIDHNCKCEATLKVQQFHTFATTLNWQPRPEVYDFLTPWKLMHRSSSFKNVSLYLGMDDMIMLCKDDMMLIIRIL